MTLGLKISLFLNEISKNPVLWDPNSEHKNNRTMRNKVWKEISARFVKNFEDLDNRDQIDIIRKLQIKWRNLRDTYVRAMKNPTANKRYVYRKHIMFLDPIYHFDADYESDEHSSVSSRKAKIEVYSGDDDDEIYFDELPALKRKSGKDQSPKSKRYKRQSTESESKNIEFVTSPSPAPALTSTRIVDGDDDVAFFDSLIPAVKQFNMDQKLSFRTEVLNLITRLRTQDPFIASKSTGDHNNA